MCLILQAILSVSSRARAHVHTQRQTDRQTDRQTHIHIHTHTPPPTTHTHAHTHTRAHTHSYAHVHPLFVTHTILMHALYSPERRRQTSIIQSVCQQFCHRTLTLTELSYKERHEQVCSILLCFCFFLICLIFLNYRRKGGM